MISILKKIIFIVIIYSIQSCNKTNETTNKSNNKDITTQDSSKTNLLKGCGFNSIQEVERNFLPPEDRVVQIINNIVSYSGLPNNFKIYRADYIDNAFATIIDNQRVIVYDSKLFNDVEWYSDSFWTSISILAHEIGHHLSGHTMDDFGSTPLKELEADKFSGYILYKMGATKEQSILAMSLLGSENDSSTHPSKSRRINSIISGWIDSNDQRYRSALPPAPNGKPEDFHVYDHYMLINNNIVDSQIDWFNNTDYLYGVVTNYNPTNNILNIRVLKSSKLFIDNFRDISNEDWDINIESPEFGNNTTMCKNCAATLGHVLSPGRRIKFKMVESLPNRGTSLNGIWFLTYLEVLPANYFK